jgi:hypothetical protein
MVIYEVNVEVEPAALEEYSLWLACHIEEILGIRGFTRADVWREQNPAADGWTSLVVHYHVNSQNELDDYLSHHTRRLRAEAEQRFAGRFRTRRRVLISTAP